MSITYVHNVGLFNNFEFTTAKKFYTISYLIKQHSSFIHDSVINLLPTGCLFQLHAEFDFLHIQHIARTKIWHVVSNPRYINDFTSWLLESAHEIDSKCFDYCQLASDWRIMGSNYVMIATYSDKIHSCL